MSDTIDSLELEFQTLQGIPRDRLYNFLNANRERFSELISKHGAEALRGSRLGKEVIRRCETDLLWLAGYFLWETNPEGAGNAHKNNALLEDTHGRICNFFVPKDKTKTIAEQDPEFKTRILLWPRGGLKSTTGIAEVVQWVLNFPQIRICFLTAADDLAAGFLEELKGHFVLKPEIPSLMNLFFPEWCVAESEFSVAKGYQCPAWYARNPGTKRKESTVNAISIGSNISGRHYEVIVADDVVSNQNATSSDMCRKIAKDFAVNRKTLRPWGYVYKIGTRYLDEDMYGEDIEKISVGELQTSVDGPCVEMLSNVSFKTKMLIGRAVVIKPDVRKRLEDEGRTPTYIEAGEEGCDLLIPHILDYGTLMKEWRDDEFVFEGQYNQNPKIQSATAFDLPLLMRGTIPPVEMPLRGPISQTWDFAFSPKKYRDYCTCATVIWDDNGGMVVIDLVRQRFTPLDLAKSVVANVRKWKPFILGIENAAGSNLLEPTIIAEALKTGDPQTIAICSKIDWVKTDSKDGSKMTRMASLHPLLVERRLKFVSHLPYLQELYTEFQKCLLNEKAKNDIPDVISRQLRYMPRMAKAVATAGLPGGPGMPLVMPYPTTKAQAEYNLLYGPWLSSNEMPSDAFGRLGMGEVPRPLVEENPPEPESEPKSTSAIADGLGPLVGW